jgi:peptidylprolyl isomerase
MFKTDFQSNLPLIGLIIFCIALVVGLSYWAGSGSSATIAELQEGEITAPLTPEAQEVYEPVITNAMNPIAVLETSKGTIEIELFTDRMPITAGNFEKLVREGFYDGTLFHRVIPNFMIQGGDPITKTDEVLRYGTGGPGYAIPDEHIAGEGLSNTRGTISMANSGPNSGGSQFFINVADNTFLDFDKEPLQSKHPVFGRVITGMEVVDAIVAVERNERDLPREPIRIERATIRSTETAS